MALTTGRVRGAIIATAAATALGTGMIVFAAQSSADTTKPAAGAVPVRPMLTFAPSVGQPVKFSVYGQWGNSALVTWSAAEAPAGVTFTGYRIWFVPNMVLTSPPRSEPPSPPASPTPPPTLPPQTPAAVRTVPATARATQVTGLTLGTNYTVHVVATGPQGETPDVPTGLYRSTVLLTRSPATAVYGAPVTLTGQVVSSGNGPRAGEAVLLERRAAGTPTWIRVGDPRTGSNLKWTLVTKPAETTAYRARFGGSKGMWPTEATTTITVRYLVSVKASKPKPKINQKVTVSGAVRPIKVGTKVSLQRHAAGAWITIAGGTVKADGSYAITKAFAKGTWPLRVIAAGGTTLAYGTSSQVTVVAK